MIQDIAPHQYNVAYQPKQPKPSDTLLIYRGGKILAGFVKDEICFPTVEEIQSIFPGAAKKAKYLFRIDERDYYELRKPPIEAFDGWKYEDILVLRRAVPMWKAFAGITGYQIHNWYSDHQFCGRCAAELEAAPGERALKCPVCGKIIYPTIAPSVIVAVTNKDQILMTRYASSHSSYKNYALVAGYAEVGETLEATVHREVMEEVGLRVKNLRYYKSQPWAFSGALLVGYFCEVDGDTSVTLEEEELCEATWFTRSEMPVKDDHVISLTNEMMEYFRIYGYPKARDGENE
ncbi:MAG: NAD(+) diphosphatase [Lachnospiraceae bacterium]|nr:NAD(+) diphosphatase [Lachnospiraceae bacterium]